MAVLQDCAKSLRDVLTPLGFKRKSSTWRRDVGDFVDIIEFQRFRFSSDYTINIGVLTKSAYQLLWGKAAPAAALACHGVVNERINHVLGPPAGWEIDDTAARASIAVQIQNRIVPYLDEMHSYAAQIQYLRRPYSSKYWQTPFYEAILLHESGDRAESCLMLRNYRPKRSGEQYGADNFLKRAAEIAARLNCPMFASTE